MYTRIVLPLDGRPEELDTLKAADELSRRWDTSIELVALVTEADDVDARLAEVERRGARLSRSHGCHVSQRAWFVAPELIDREAIDDETLVVMATSAPSRSESFLGSVAGSMLRLLERPVLLIGPNCTIGAEWPSGPVLACTDGSHHSESIVEPARDWSASLDMPLWIVSVGYPVTPDAQEIHESAHVSHVAHDVAGDGQGEVNFDVLHGRRPADSIVDYATRVGAGLIAMSTHAHRGLRRLALGSVAMSVVHEARCPVLVVQPGVED